MKIELKELKVTENVKRMFDPENHREDIDPKKLYLVKYSNTWLIGRFHLLTYDKAHPRWVFNPNIGAVNPQIDMLTEIYEIDGLPQNVDGSTAAHILGYLSKQNDEEDDNDYGYHWSDNEECY